MFAHQFLIFLQPWLLQYGISRVKYVIQTNTKESLVSLNSCESLTGFIEDATLEITTNSDFPSETRVILIANQLLSALPMDHYRIQKRKLEECLLSITRSLNKKSESTLTTQWTYQQVLPLMEFYQSENCNFVIRRYCDEFKDEELMEMLLPVGGIELIEDLAEKYKGRLLVLAVDRAIWHNDDLLARGSPVIQKGHSLRFPIDFHALETVIERSGGFTMLSDYRAGLQYALFGYGILPSQFPKTRSAFRNLLACNPVGVVAGIYREISHLPKLTQELAAETLRLSRRDPELIHDLQMGFLNPVGPSSDQELNNRVLSDLSVSSLLCFSENSEIDCLFDIGRIRMKLKDYQGAIEAFITSLHLAGSHHITHHNIGMCYFFLKDYLKSKKSFEKSLMLKSTRESTIWLDRVVDHIREIETKKQEGKLQLVLEGPLIPSMEGVSAEMVSVQPDSS
eukprot:TRINITY_DN22489_c0_g1_i1.p1 TRINITY_DN22489_c0_g1~~TRINITY_DN22489_c0_g1_i1.p1  ORF type:complete len:522 (+),score=98.60 TRINITY_DN22489_c0_g1_i1:208-1566(+)